MVYQLACPGFRILILCTRFSSSFVVRFLVCYFFHKIYLLFYIWLFTLSQIKTICNPLAHPTWKCTTLTCEIPNLFYVTEGLHCTCIFRTCVFHPCEMRCFVLALSALAFSSTCVFSAPSTTYIRWWRHNLWPRYDRHFVGIRRYNLWS